MDFIKDKEEHDNEKDKNSEAIKIILIGDVGTGKTSLIMVSAGLKFNSKVLTTRRCSYIEKKFILNNAAYKANIWDTIGQEKYRSLTKLFVKESKIIILVYDITNRTSFESLTFWKKIVDEMVEGSHVIGIVGNKMDLYFNEQVKKEEVKEYAKSIGVKYLLTSAKTDTISFNKFMGELLQDFLKMESGEKIERFSLNRKKTKDKDKKKKKCC